MHPVFLTQIVDDHRADRERSARQARQVREARRARRAERKQRRQDARVRDEQPKNRFFGQAA